MTKTNTLGFVVGVPIGYAIGNVNAFEMGARSVNPKAQTRVVVTGGWSDKAKEAAAANALIDQGADVVTMHVNSPATIIQVAEGRGKLFDRLPVHRGPATGAEILDHRARLHLGPVHDGDGKERHGRYLQAGDGARGARPDDGGGDVVGTPEVPADVQKLVTASADQVEHGFNPFTGPVTDNTGTVSIDSGKSWGGDKMGNFDWYVEGVIGKAK